MKPKPYIIQESYKVIYYSGEERTKIYPTKLPYSLTFAISDGRFIYIGFSSMTYIGFKTLESSNSIYFRLMVS